MEGERKRERKGGREKSPKGAQGLLDREERLEEEEERD